ncbi:cupin domain-containing protein [bacterium]|nr:cupin domain-containing protein [bacterium]
MSKIRILKPEIHPKGWGKEIWIINNDKYCGKLLHFTAGASFSDHFHLKKDETWYILQGSIELRHYDLTNAERIIDVLKEGDVVHVPIGAPHQLTALTDAIVLEVSTPHDEKDSYRIGKGDSQKIDSADKNLWENYTQFIQDKISPPKHE